MKIFVYGVLSLPLFFFVFCGISLATPPVVPQLPEAIQYEIATIRHSSQSENGQFEYEITVRSNFDLENVELIFAGTEDVVWETEPETFFGQLAKGQTLKWRLKGRVDPSLRDPEDEFPGLPASATLGISYEFPYAEMKDWVEREMNGETPSLGPHDVAYLQSIMTQEKEKPQHLVTAWIP